MKYKYNNQWNELTVKASDTLPIGTIVDYDGETVPSGHEEVSDPTEYSTTEQVIGTWTDNKPIYRQVVSGTKVSGTNFTYNIANVDKVVSLNGTMTASGIAYNINRYESSSVWTYCCFASGQIRVISSTGQYSNGTILIIIEYTKTTD